MLAPHPQRLAARRNDLQVRTSAKECVDPEPNSLDLLQIVQDEERRSLRQTPLESFQCRLVRRCVDSHCARDVGKALIRAGLGREVDEEHTAPKSVDMFGRCLERKAGLPRSSGAHEGYESRLGTVHQLLDPVERIDPAEKRRCLGGEVVRCGVERGERRECIRHSGGDDLEDVLRFGEVLEPVLAKVPEINPHGGCHRGGDEDLPSVAGRHEPSRPVDHRSEVVAVSLLGFTLVDADPDLDSADLAPLGGSETLLHRDGRLQAGSGVVEHRHDPVSG